MKATFSAPLEKFEASLYPYHVKVPDVIYQSFRSDGVKRIMVTFNDGTAAHNAFLPAGDGVYYIKLNQKTIKAEKLVLGEPITVHVCKDDSKYGAPIIPEMEELLLQDTEGEVLFHALTPGKIRSLLFRIHKYKSSAKRIDKAIIILDHLKANNGKLDWKLLSPLL